MQIHYRHTFRDIMTWNFYYLFHSPILYGVFIVILGIGIKPNINAISRYTDLSQFSKIIFFIVLELVPVILSIIIMVVMMLLFMIGKGNKNVYADHTLTLSDEHIESESEVGKAELSWKAIQKIVRTKAYIYMFVSPHNAVSVPRRVFASNAEWDQFWAICQANTPQKKKK